MFVRGGILARSSSEHNASTSMCLLNVDKLSSATYKAATCSSALCIQPIPQDPHVLMQEMTRMQCSQDHSSPQYFGEMLVSSKALYQGASIESAARDAWVHTDLGQLVQVHNSRSIRPSHAMVAPGNVQALSCS